MNFEQIYSEPDEIKQEPSNFREKIKAISMDLKSRKRNAVQISQTINLMNESSEADRQHQDLLTFFRKNIYIKRCVNHLIRKKKIITKNQKEIL